MKPSILVLFSLLLNSFLHSKAQGIPLEGGLLTDKRSKHNVQDMEMETGNLLKRSHSGSDEKAILLCKEGRYYCSSIEGTMKKITVDLERKKAMNRKLLVFTFISSTQAMSKKVMIVENNKNAKVHGKKEETKVNSFSSSSFSKHQELLRRHEELADITEMDYTAARRRPPVHN